MRLLGLEPKTYGLKVAAAKDQKRPVFFGNEQIFRPFRRVCEPIARSRRVFRRLRGMPEQSEYSMSASQSEVTQIVRTANVRVIFGCGVGQGQSRFSGDVVLPSEQVIWDERSSRVRGKKYRLPT